MRRWVLLLLAPIGAAAAGAGAWYGLQPVFAPRPVAPARLAEASPSAPAPSSSRGRAVVPQPVAPPSAPATSTPLPPGPAPDATPPAPAAAAPSFDIVRVAPDGAAVVAGRSAPGAEVTLRADGKTIGRARADPEGQFVLLPEAPLPAGGRELTLSARGPDGAEREASAPVIVLVPKAGAAGPAAKPEAAPPAAVAVLAPADAPPRVLQSPTVAKKGQLGLDVVDYDDKGQIRFSGSARPGAKVQLYVDDRLLGQALAAAEGNWSLEPRAGAVTTGEHKLRVDQVGSGGRVTARVELPFQRVVLTPLQVPADRIVVQPRQNLWRIARQTYGRGMRYTVIYEANRDQIRDPDLIYPGQVFALPTASPSGSTPTPSASKSK